MDYLGKNMKYIFKFRKLFSHMGLLPFAFSISTHQNEPSDFIIWNTEEQTCLWKSINLHNL